MPKERLKSPRVRLFVALDLPGRVREALLDWQERELADPALRPVPAKSLHVTLCFLGWTPEKRIPECEEALGGIAPRPVPMRLEPEPMPLPKRRPRLFALDAPSEAATKLAGEVSDALEAKHLYEPEKRPFWSHVTVARVRGKRDAGKRVKPPAPLDPAACEPFEAVRLTFYRSNLSSHGAEYVALASTDLPPA